jgi:uncharacterized protein YndB with AHSA1/START domain
MTDLSLTVERTIKAPRETVFDAWLNPQMLQRFMMPAAHMTVPSASSDATKGGRFEIVMRADENDMPHRGTYREIDPHDRIVFTWESPFSEEDSLVTLTFADADEGTHLTLLHERFLDEQSRDNHHGGWTSILQSLDNALT